MIARGELERDVVVAACAISAGIHAALVPAHRDEGGLAGVAFALAALFLAATAVAVTRCANAPTLAFAALLLAGLIAAYALAITSGLPLVHPRPEPIEGLALATKAVELVGLGAATGLLAHSHRALPVTTIPRPKGTAA